MPFFLVIVIVIVNYPTLYSTRQSYIWCCQEYEFNMLLFCSQMSHCAVRFFV